MKNKRAKSNYTSGWFRYWLSLRRHTYFNLLILVLASIFGIIFSTYLANKKPMNNETNILYNNGWQYSIDDNNEFHDIIFPANIKENITKYVILKNKLPQIYTDPAILLIRTSQQMIKIYIDDKLLYSCNGEIKGKVVPTSSYYFVELPIDYIGKEIKLVIESPYLNYAKIINQIFIGSKTSHLFYIVNRMGIQFILGAIVFAVGIILLITFILLIRSHFEIMNFILLGCFFTCTGFWVMEESTLLQFFIDNPNLITNLAIFSLSLMPVFSGMYFYNTYIVHYRKILRFLIIVYFVLSIIIAVISMINTLLPIAILTYYTVFLGIYTIIIILTILMEFKRAEKKLIPSIVGIVIFILLALVCVISYLYDITTYYLNFFTLGLFLFCIIMISDLFKYISDIYKTSIKVNILTDLAYTDSLTGLNNHSAFLKKLKSIILDETGSITIMVFDLNNLKMINDSNGHLAGDALLKYCGDSLKSLFRAEDDLFRIGGDEFVAIICNTKTIELEDIENRIINTLKKEDLKPSHNRLDVAYGYATYNSKTDRDLFATFNRADANMYKCKTKQKNIRKLV